MRFYKYMQQEYVEAFLAKGVLRVGSLYEYRNTEVHGAQVGDAREGKKDVYINANGKYNKDNAPPILNRMLELPAKGYVSIRGITFVQGSSSQDLLIYSVCRKLDSAIMQKFGYDSALEIVDPRRFFRRITLALGSGYKFQGVAACIYGGREVEHTNDPGHHPALLKDSSHSYQEEYRAIWSKAEGEVEPLILECGYMTRLCKLVQF